MKKYTWIVAFVMALSLAFIGCGDGGGGDPDPEGAFDIVLTANSHTPTGFHIAMSDSWLMNGNRVMTGDEFRLEIEFTLSRDIDDDLLIFLVDNSGSGVADNPWWTHLSCLNDDDADRIPAAELKAGQTISKTITLTAVRNASSAAAAANVLCIETKNEAQTLAPITISFTKFNFTKLGEDEEPEVFDLAALRALPGGITLGVGGSTAPVFDAESRVVTVTGSTSSMFHFTWEAAGFDFEGVADDANIRITYACVIDSGEAKIVVKSGANSWTDVDPPSYPSLIEGPSNSLQLLKSRIGVSANGISFQHNAHENPDPVLYHVKILGLSVAE